MRKWRSGEVREMKLVDYCILFRFIVIVLLLYSLFCILLIHLN